MSNRIVGPIAKELIAAKARIENPENWCQHHPRDNGKVCAVIALQIASEGDDTLWDRGCSALRRAARKLYPDSSLADVNAMGHAVILTVFDHAIQRAIREGR